MGIPGLKHVQRERVRLANKLYIFFCPSPLPFGGSTVLSLTRGRAGNRTTGEDRLWESKFY